MFKKLHHTACTKAVNEKYGSTYGVDQVHRHFRRHKETWALVARHMNASGKANSTVRPYPIRSRLFGVKRTKEAAQRVTA